MGYKPKLKKLKSIHVRNEGDNTNERNDEVSTDEEGDEAASVEYQSVVNLSYFFITLIMSMFLTLPGGYEESRAKVGSPRLLLVSEFQVFFVAATIGSLFSFAVVFLKIANPNASHYIKMKPLLHPGLVFAGVSTLIAYISLILIMFRAVDSDRYCIGIILSTAVIFFGICSFMARL